jgi:hypothetical protein
MSNVITLTGLTSTVVPPSSLSLQPAVGKEGSDPTFVLIHSDSASWPHSKVETPATRQHKKKTRLRDFHVALIDVVSMSSEERVEMRVQEINKASGFCVVLYTRVPRREGGPGELLSLPRWPSARLALHVFFLDGGRNYINAVSWRRITALSNPALSEHYAPASEAHASGIFREKRLETGSLGTQRLGLGRA